MLSDKVIEKGMVKKMDKIKKISKYVVNFLNMINALILALSPIWDWHLDNISKTIVAITGVISLYLVSGKLFSMEEKGEWNTMAKIKEETLKELSNGKGEPDD